jgi:hypothetical protein
VRPYPQGIGRGGIGLGPRGLGRGALEP